MNYKNLIHHYAKILEEFFADKKSLFEEVVNKATESLKAGHKILIFGNGGSAAQAQHFAAEMVNKFQKIRLPLKAISLTTDTSALTSISNDTSFDHVFSRQIEALGDEGDLAFALSTSGNSPNVIKAVSVAKKKEMLSVGLTGRGGGGLAQLVDYLLDIPSESTPRIQEAHLLILHLLAQELEDRMS